MLGWITLFIAGYLFFRWRRSITRIKDMNADAKNLRQKIRDREEKIRNGEINPDDPEEKAAMRAARRARRRR